MQTWAHPKYGDRLDVGLARQVEDGVDALQVRSCVACLFPCTYSLYPCRTKIVSIMGW